MSEQVMEVEDFLAHYGVKGMRWGRRKAKVSNADIKAARKRVQQKAAIDYDKLGKLEKNVYNAKSNAAQKKALDKFNRAEKQVTLQHLKNPDRATAMRMTTGEKWATAIVGVALTGGGAAAYAGARVAARKTIEKRQASGYYDRKKK